MGPMMPIAHPNQATRDRFAQHAFEVGAVKLQQTCKIRGAQLLAVLVDAVGQAMSVGVTLPDGERPHQCEQALKRRFLLAEEVAILVGGNRIERFAAQLGRELPQVAARG
jgi:hypothetical protein